MIYNYPTALRRAREIWGPTVIVSKLTADSPWWWIELPGDATIHRLNERGHVTCHHHSCELLESRLEERARGQRETTTAGD
jgi:hypothetical protein